MKLAVLASGRGTNFAAIADAVKSGAVPRSEVVGLLCNRPGAPVLELAKKRGIPSQVVDSARFRIDGTLEREPYERELSQALERWNPDWVCLAGYMLILGEAFVRRWEGKMMNIHPSLLPAFPGLSPQKQALEAGVKETGCTVHLVTSKVDDGPVLARGRIPVLPGDTVASLSARLLPVEHATYVEALKKLATRSAKT